MIGVTVTIIEKQIASYYFTSLADKLSDDIATDGGGLMMFYLKSTRLIERPVIDEIESENDWPRLPVAFFSSRLVLSQGAGVSKKVNCTTQIFWKQSLSERHRRIQLAGNREKTALFDSLIGNRPAWTGRVERAIWDNFQPCKPRQNPGVLEPRAYQFVLSWFKLIFFSDHETSIHFTSKEPMLPLLISVMRTGWGNDRETPIQWWRHYYRDLRASRAEPTSASFGNHLQYFPRDWM